MAVSLTLLCLLWCTGWCLGTYCALVWRTAVVAGVSDPIVVYFGVVAGVYYFGLETGVSDPIVAYFGVVTGV